MSSLSALFGGDTGALSADGTTYTVESGDGLWKIAQKLVGDGNRYRELFAVNTQYPRTADGSNFKNVWVGMVLKLPASWVKSTSVSAPAASAPVTAQSAAAILQAKATLAAWGATDGRGASGLTDYGAQPTDLSSDWSARDKLMAASFENQQNGKGSALPTDGGASGALFDALRDWAEAKAASVVPVVNAAPVATVPAPAPSTQTSIGLPPMTITAPAPVPAPVSAPVALPSIGSFPALPPVTAPTPSAPAVVTTPPGVPKMVKPAPKKDGGGDLFVPVAIGLGVIAKAMAFI
jgi:LysM repeat protein